MLQNATEHKEKPAIKLDQEEPKIILSSATDTVVKAPIDVVISTVRKDEEGKWEIVCYKKDYWFWLTGISKVLVKKDQKLKNGGSNGNTFTG